MPILTKENINKILEKLKEEIKKSLGVEICIKQESVNFENWVQVELCDILGPFINSSNMIVEWENRDLVVTKEGIKWRKIKDIKRDDIKMAIEIKIIHLGPEGAFPGKDKCKNDISKLKMLSPSVEKAFLCVVYQSPNKKRCKKFWKRRPDESSSIRDELLNSCEINEQDQDVPKALHKNGDPTEIYLDFVMVK